MHEQGEDNSAKLHTLPTGILTSLAEHERAADYDHLAFGYDMLVGNPLYNKLVWGCAKREYRAAAERFLAKCRSDRVLDFGCGSLVFTAHAYRDHLSRLTLFDRSLGMLERAQKRATHGHFVQGDAFNPPFGPQSFNGAMSWGMLHVFGTASSFLDELSALLMRGAPVAISTLVVGERAIGDRMLRTLHARGEVAAPETAATVCECFGRVFDLEDRKVIGSMLFLTGRKSAN